MRTDQPEWKMPCVVEMLLPAPYFSWWGSLTHVHPSTPFKHVNGTFRCLREDCFVVTRGSNKQTVVKPSVFCDEGLLPIHSLQGGNYTLLHTSFAGQAQHVHTPGLQRYHLRTGVTPVTYQSHSGHAGISRTGCGKTDAPCQVQPVTCVESLHCIGKESEGTCEVPCATAS